jgi:retinol dehydrogenase 12
MYFFCNLYYGSGFALIFLILLKNFFNGAKNRHFPNLKNKIIIITGSNAGIGKATAEELYKLGANVILACRSKEKTMEVIKEIKENKKINSEIEFMELDLQDLKSVKQFATNFKKRYNKCDILINNAGIFMD